MAEGTRAYRRIGTRDPAAQRLARTLAQTEQVLTDGRRDRLLFHNLWGGRWARVLGAEVGFEGGGQAVRRSAARSLQVTCTRQVQKREKSIWRACGEGSQT